MNKTPVDPQTTEIQSVELRLLKHAELSRANRLLDKHHYLGRVQPVGERLYYVATDTQGQWLGLLVFNAPAKHLRARDQWIKWTPAQRRRRLSLVVNNSRFLLLPKAKKIPNLASKLLSLATARLPDDWQARYGHPVLVIETFVDPEQFCGTVYTAHGWEELGETDGWGRKRRDYYVKHDKPKRLFVRELATNARRSLQAEHLKPDLAIVEAKTPPRCQQSVKEIRSMVEHFKKVPDFRGRVESYPLWSLLTIILLAVMCDAPRGQKDLAKFARGFSQEQRRALGIRRNRQGKYPAPSQSTFCRMLLGVDDQRVDETIRAIQSQIRGPAPKDELVVLDGKEPRHGGGQQVLSAISVPSQYYLGSAIVETSKTNEIPAARQLSGQLDLENRFVSLDALHTQDDTARTVVLEGGGDYLLTAKGNQPTVHKTIRKLVSAPEADFPPSASDADPGSNL